MILLRKAARAMLSNKRAYLACIVLITIGIMIYVAMGIASLSLETSKQKYYSDYRLADVFAKVFAIPESRVDTLERLEGIDVALGRQVVESRVLIPGNEKIISLRLISVVPEAQFGVNGYRFSGRDFEMPNDLMVGEEFLQAHSLEPGDSLKLVVNGRECDFTICASMQSPEYVYAIKSAKDVMPDPETFSVAFVRQDDLFAVTGNFGVYNDLSFKLEPGYTFEDVKVLLEDELQKYGLTELIEAKDQVSVSMLNAEIDGVKAYAASMPVVFVFMAIAILYLMLKRVIEQDRTQIGTLKAFGYSKSTILLHYMVYGGITGSIGGLLGCLFGYLLSGQMIIIYGEFFSLPGLEPMFVGRHMIVGLIIALGGGLLGALTGAVGTLRLNPAESMRPVAPKQVKHDILKYLFFLKYILSSRGSMALRNIERNKVRSLFVAVGVMFSFAMLAFMGSYSSMIDSMMLDQFTKIQIYDAKIALEVSRNYDDAVRYVQGLDGVEYAEGLMEMPVELKQGHRKKGVAIIGLPEDALLYKVYDSKLKTVRKLPPEGIIITNALADALEAKRGDIILISSPLLEDDTPVIVWDIVTQNLGMGCYMELDALSRLFNTNKTATSVMVNVSDMASLKEQITDGKNVAVIEDKAGTLAKYNEMLEPYTSMIYILELMAAVVAFAIIYNATAISLSERKREYATLRVMGLHISEVAEIMSFEYWLLSFIGMAMGVPLTTLLKKSMASAMEVEAFTFPTDTPTEAYIVAVVGCMAAVLMSMWSSRRSIKKFDMVEVLKERE